MTDCENETMRDLLPLLAHDALEPAEAARVRAHVAACAACAREIALLTSAQALFRAATPAVDVNAILRRLPAANESAGGRPAALRVLRPTAKPRFAMPRYALAAAASLVLVGTLSLSLLRPVFIGGGAGVDVASLDSGGVPVTRGASGLLGASDLGDLSAEELALLLDELEQMEATIADEPVTMREPLAPLPEGI